MGLTIRQGAKVDFGGSVRSIGYRKSMSMTFPSLGGNEPG